MCPFLVESPEQERHLSHITFLDSVQGLTRGSSLKVCSKRMGLPVAHLNPPRHAVPTASSGYVSAQSPHLFKKYVSSTYYVLSTILGTWDVAMNRTDRFACLHGADMLVGERQ